MRASLTFALACFLAVVSSPVLAADDLASVEKQLAEKVDKHKSMQAKIVTEMNQMIPGVQMEIKGEGTVELLRKGSDTLTRFEMKTTMKRGTGEGEAQTMEQSVLAITDANATYILNDVMGQKQAMKLDVDPQFSAKPTAVFDALRKSNQTLTLEPEQSVSGKKAWVVKAVPGEEMGPARPTLLYFDQETGFMLKMESMDEQGKVQQTVEYRDLRVDVSIEENRFEWKTPEGVTLMDQTTKKADAPTTTAPAAPTTAPAKP